MDRLQLQIMSLVIDTADGGKPARDFCLNRIGRLAQEAWRTAFSSDLAWEILREWMVTAGFCSCLGIIAISGVCGSDFE